MASSLSFAVIYDLSYLWKKHGDCILEILPSPIQDQLRFQKYSEDRALASSSMTAAIVPNEVPPAMVGAIGGGSAVPSAAGASESPSMVSAEEKPKKKAPKAPRLAVANEVVFSTSAAPARAGATGGGSAAPSATGASAPKIKATLADPSVTAIAGDSVASRKRRANRPNIRLLPDYKDQVDKVIKGEFTHKTAQQWARKHAPNIGLPARIIEILENSPSRTLTFDSLYKAVCCDLKLVKTGESGLTDYIRELDKMRIIEKLK